MVLSSAGEIVAYELENTPIIRPNVSLDTWGVMPNHIHAIIEIVETPRRGVSTGDQGTSTKNQDISRWGAGTLGAIINQYESICTKRIRAMGCTDFAWQSRFYDHIIRNEKSARIFILMSSVIQSNG
jgi:putative transposase